MIDMSTVIAGPGAARHLADFGADVIKVEPPAGDATRLFGWTVPGDSDSLFWKLVNRGKRSATLDLRDEADRQLMLRLVDTAQVLVENMRPGKLERLGLGPDILLSRNPALVILRVSGFGQTGPYAQRPGFATIAEALSGLSAISGEPHGGPLLPPIALTDEVTALAGAFATMVALRHAERTGSGQVVDVNLLESMLQMLGPLPAAWGQLGYLQPRLGSGLPYTAPRGTYRCADGTWVALSASADSVAGRVLQLLGVDGDPRFGDFPARLANREALEQLTRDWISVRPSAGVLATFDAVDAAIAPVYTMADVAADPHVRAREALVDVDGISMQNVVARLSATPGSIRGAGPRLGQHNEEIFGKDPPVGRSPSGTPDPERNPRPSVVVFDVNETLSDLRPMAARFAGVGAPEQLARLWFAMLLRDGFALTAAGDTERFATIGSGLLRVLLHDTVLNRGLEDAVQHIIAGFLGLPLHPDVPDGIVALHRAGLRLVTLSNGSGEVAKRLLSAAGISDHFEALLSVEEAGVWKPARGAYEYAARVCDTEPSDMLLVAVHPWDIHGASRAGLRTGWLNRHGEAFPEYFTKPSFQAATLPELAAKLPR